MGAAVALRNVVGEAEHLFVVGVVPLHGNVDGDVGALIGQAFAGCLENRWVQYALGFVDVFNEATGAAFERENFFLAGTLVGQFDVARRC